MPPVRPFGNIESIVFDLGGVLLRLRGPIENFDLHIPEAQKVLEST